MTMTFKEALIAHLQTEKVECREGIGYSWQSFAEYYCNTRLSTMMTNGYSEGYEFRLAPRTILVNGVEVPAPEKYAPKEGDGYFVPQPDYDEYAQRFTWTGHDCELRFLNLGLVYLDKESAIARAKAMLITQEVK